MTTLPSPPAPAPHSPAAIPEDASDPLVRHHRSAVELLCCALAWPSVLLLSQGEFRDGLGLLLQLLAAGRTPAGRPGSSVREVLLGVKGEQVELMLGLAGGDGAAAAFLALQQELGWSPRLAARVLLGCSPAQAACQLLDNHSSSGLDGHPAVHLLLADGLLDAGQPGEGGVAGSRLPSGSQLLQAWAGASEGSSPPECAVEPCEGVQPASLLAEAAPRHIREVAAWLR